MILDEAMARYPRLLFRLVRCYLNLVGYMPTREITKLWFLKLYVDLIITVKCLN